MATLKRYDGLDWVGLVPGLKGETGDTGPQGPPGAEVQLDPEIEVGQLLEVESLDPPVVRGTTSFVASDDIDTVQVITETAYEELSPKDDRTFYIIIEDPVE